MTRSGGSLWRARRRRVCKIACKSFAAREDGQARFCARGKCSERSTACAKSWPKLSGWKGFGPRFCAPYDAVHARPGLINNLTVREHRCGSARISRVAAARISDELLTFLRTKRTGIAAPHFTSAVLADVRAGFKPALRCMAKCRTACLVSIERFDSHDRGAMIAADPESHRRG